MTEDNEDKDKKPKIVNPWGKQPDDSEGQKPQSPWSRPNGDPWANKPSDPQSKNLDDLAKRIEDKLKGVLGGSGGGRRDINPQHGGRPSSRLIGAIALFIGVLWLMSGIYVVDAGEEALITRFGKYVGTTTQGLNYRLPYPFENNTTINVKRVNTLSVGAPADNPSSTSGLMLTGDENIVDVGFTVFWQIKDTKQFVFNVAHGDNSRQSADATVGAVAEAAMREVVGHSEREKILSTGRAQVESETRELIQKTLNYYNSGILVTQVNLTKADPPQSVIDAFRQVAAAGQEAETKINQALAYRNSVIPQAQGEAARFNQLYLEYKLAPEVTRQRLYLETMERIYARANKIYVEKGNGNTPLMVLPPDLLKNSNVSPSLKNEGGGK